MNGGKKDPKCKTCAEINKKIDQGSTNGFTDQEAAQLFLNIMRSKAHNIPSKYDCQLTQGRAEMLCNMMLQCEPSENIITIILNEMTKFNADHYENYTKKDHFTGFVKLQLSLYNTFPFSIAKKMLQEHKNNYTGSYNFVDMIKTDRLAALNFMLSHEKFLFDESYFDPIISINAKDSHLLTRVLCHKCIPKKEHLHKVMYNGNFEMTELFASYGIDQEDFDLYCNYSPYFINSTAGSLNYFELLKFFYNNHENILFTQKNFQSLKGSYVYSNMNIISFCTDELGYKLEYSDLKFLIIFHPHCFKQFEFLFKYDPEELEMLCENFPNQKNSNLKFLCDKYTSKGIVPSEKCLMMAVEKNNNELMDYLISAGAPVSMEIVKKFYAKIDLSNKLMCGLEKNYVKRELKQEPKQELKQDPKQKLELEEELKLEQELMKEQELLKEKALIKEQKENIFVTFDDMETEDFKKIESKIRSLFSLPKSESTSIFEFKKCIFDHFIKHDLFSQIGEKTVFKIDKALSKLLKKKDGDLFEFSEFDNCVKHLYAIA
jgi:ankyrin repeat protein